MASVDEAKEILIALGLPTAQQNERSALTLLALANLGADDKWAEAEQRICPFRPAEYTDYIQYFKEGYQ